MKKFLAAGLVSLGLVSCDNSAELRKNCVIMLTKGIDNEAYFEAQEYIKSEIKSSKGTGSFCEKYLEK